MRKITLLMVVMAVMWSSTLFGQTSCYVLKENFTTTPATNWGFVSNNGSTQTFNYDATNKVLQVRWPNGNSNWFKTLSSAIIAGSDNKVTVEIILQAYTSGNTSNFGAIYLLDESGNAITGVHLRRGKPDGSNNIWFIGRCTQYLGASIYTSYPTSADPMNADQPIVKVTFIIDFTAKTFDYTAQKGTYDFVNRVFTSAGGATYTTYVHTTGNAFLNSSAANFKTFSSYYYKASGASATGTNGLDLISTNVIRNVTTPPNINNISTNPVCQNSSATINLTGMAASSTGNKIDYTIDGVAQTQITGVSADASGNASFSTPVLTYATHNGKSLVITKITDSNGNFLFFSNSTTLSVNPTSAGGTAAASNATSSIQIVEGNATTVSLTGYTGAIQWQSSPDGTNSWSDISGATSSTYTTPTLSAGTYYYRANVTSGSCSSSTSNSVTVTAAAAQAIPPSLIASESATVDGTFDVTFTNDGTWQGAITGITVGGTILDQSAYNTSVANKITFTPSASALLQSPGSKTIVISATGYNVTTVSQAISAGIATQLAMKTQPVTPLSNGAVFATQPEVYVKDQYGNLTTGGTIIASVTSPQTWLLGGTTSKSASSGTATFTDLTAGTSGQIAYSGATLTFTLGNITTNSNAFDIIAYQSTSSDYFQTKQSGIWSDPTTWYSSPDGATWYAATIAPASTNTTIFAAHPVTYTNTTDFSQTGFSMENNAELDLKPGGATTYAGSISPLSGKTITIANSNTITIKSYTEANAKNLTVFYSPTISSTSPTVNMDLNIAGRLYNSSAQWSTGYAMTLPTNSQLNVTSSIGSAGFAISTDSKFLNTKIALGNNVRVLRQYNVAATTGSTIDIGELSSIDTNPSTCTSTLEGSWITTDQTRILTYSIGSLGTNSTFAGTFKNYPLSNVPAVYIKKVGNGNLTLSGTYNNLTSGQLNVTAGTVTLNGSLPNYAVTTNVSAGATLTGTGYIAGTTTINGTLGGSLSFAGAVTLSSGSTISQDTYITLITNGTNSGTLALQNGTTIPNLIVTSTSAPAIGSKINLVIAADPSTITYSNAPVVPAGYSFNTNTGVLTYDGNSLASSTNISSASLPSNASITVSAGNTLTIDQTSTVNSITVAPGAQVTLNSGINLTANTVELQSSASGTATFVDADATGKTVTGTIQQYLPTGRNWYVGIPIANGDNSTTASSLTAGGATSVSYWDEPTGAWVNDYSGALTKGRGYIAVSGSGSATNNISFTGTFNTGGVPVTVTRTVGATKEGFNLIANPYPSYLNPCDLITASSKMEPTIWYRTKGAAYSFETVNTASGVGTNGVTGYIPPMQAFWVRVKANATDAAQNNSETLTFTNAMRYHANPTVNSNTVTTTALKAPKSIQNMLLRLQISNGTSADEAIIYANANALNTYDIYDSHKMSNNSALVPEIYTTVGSEQLVINGLNEIPLNTEIPLGFSNLQSGTNSFKLRASELRNISSDTKVFLLDKSTNAETELTATSDYTFTSEAANTTSRFSVIFKSVGQTTGTANASDKNAIVYINNGHIVFVASEIPTGNNNSLMIFDATGRKVADRNITSTVTGINNINIPGVYLVRAVVNGQPYSAKINLNH